VPGRVSSRRQFALFANPTGRGQSGPLRISFVVSSREPTAVDVAFAISRKVGNAVVRNQIRRRLRALFDELSPPPQSGIYLIKCGLETGKITYDELRNHLTQALERCGALS
jgi:ribonuclease P protein component